MPTKKNKKAPIKKGALKKITGGLGLVGNVTSSDIEVEAPMAPPLYDGTGGAGGTAGTGANTKGIGGIRR